MRRLRRVCKVDVLHTASGVLPALTLPFLAALSVCFINSVTNQMDDLFNIAFQRLIPVCFNSSWIPNPGPPEVMIIADFSAVDSSDGGAREGGLPPGCWGLASWYPASADSPRRWEPLYLPPHQPLQRLQSLPCPAGSTSWHIS